MGREMGNFRQAVNGVPGTEQFGRQAQFGDKQSTKFRTAIHSASEEIVPPNFEVPEIAVQAVFSWMSLASGYLHLK